MKGQIQIPIELLEQFERGNVLLFVGEGINQGILPSAAQMAQELATRCDYPPGEPVTLPRVAGYYELTRNDRHGLVQFLRDRLDKPSLELPRAHELAAQLRPPVIITTCYDRLLERALREASIPYVQVVGNAEVAYAEEKKVLLVWLWGVLDQPDSIIVTEDDRRMFLEGRSNLSDVLRGELARRTWLFIGFDTEDEWFRGFYDSVNRGLDRQSRRAYIFGDVPGAYTRAWWEKHNAEILNADVETFLDVLNEQLVARAQPESARRMAAVTVESLPLPEEPYKALVSYEAQDRALFFGRDREIEDLVALMHAQRLVLLYGASGVGKTSLLQAGAIPRLEAATPGYTVINVRALTDPADAIRATLRRRLPDAKLGSDDASLVDFLAAAVRASDRPLMLVIDQFEEFFIRLSPEFRAAFIGELGAIYDARDLPVKVVLSLREDYLARISEIEDRIPEIFRTKMRLLPLTREQARAAIVCPVEAIGYSYAPNLVARLLDDLTREGVIPPQLQLVCSALFRHARREGRKTLTLADYEALDRAQGVLRGYLDEELHRLPTDEQALARDMFEELVTSKGTKKVATLAQLVVALAAEPDRLGRVAEKLVQARLLRFVEWADAIEPAYELAHEYLIEQISVSSELKQRKQGEELLQHEMENWLRFDSLMGNDRFDFLNLYRDTMRLSFEQAAFMLRCAIRYSRELEYWIEILGARDAVRILADILNEKEAWTKQLDRVNALRATLYLPSDMYEPLLCQYALLEKHALAKEARSLLRAQNPETRERIAHHFYNLWLSQEENERKGILYVLAELDSPMATTALDEILQMQSESERLECIEIIAEAEPNQAQELLAQYAVCDVSDTVRGRAAKYLHKAPAVNVANRTYELSIPSYQNYAQYFRPVWLQLKMNMSVNGIFQSAVLFWTLLIDAVKHPTVFCHNRALRVASRFLAEDSLDSLVEIIDKELQLDPNWQERSLGWLSLIAWIPIFAISLYWPFSVHFILFAVVCLYLVGCFIYRRSKLYKQDLSSLPWIKNLVTRQDKLNFILAQGIPISILIAMWIVIVVIGFLYLLNLELLGEILLMIWGVSAVIYIIFFYFILTNVLKSGNSISRNVSWFISGPTGSIRWYTATTMVRYLKENELIASLERFSNHPEYKFPVEVAKRVCNRVGYDVQSRSNREYYIEHKRLEKVFRKVLKTTADPGTWYFAGSKLSKHNKKSVQQIAREEIQRPDLRFRIEAKQLLRPRYVWLHVSFYIAMCVLGIFGLYHLYITNLFPSVWHLYLNDSEANVLWIYGPAQLYRVTVDEERNRITELLVDNAAIATMACDSKMSRCFVSTDDQHIVSIIEGEMKRLPQSTLISQVDTMWVGEYDEETILLWAKSGARLFVSEDLGSTWNEPFAHLFVESFAPMDKNHAMFVSRQATLESAQSVVYVTYDGGELWEKATEQSSNYDWLEPAVKIIHKPHNILSPYVAPTSTPPALDPTPPAFFSTTYYSLARGKHPEAFLAPTDDHQLWRSIDGLTWSQVFAPDVFLDHRSCKAWFSPVSVEAYGKATVLYFSYSLLDGEQGVYLSEDLGVTWEKVTLRNTAPLLSEIAHLHPACGKVW